MNSSDVDYRRQGKLLERGCKNSRLKILKRDTANLEALILCLDFIIDDTFLSKVFL